MYRSQDGTISYVDEPPVVTVIADELLRLWGCPESGILTVHTLQGPLVYDVIGADLMQNSWVAIRVSEAEAGPRA